MSVLSLAPESTPCAYQPEVIGALTGLPFQRLDCLHNVSLHFDSRFKRALSAGKPSAVRGLLTVMFHQ